MYRLFMPGAKLLGIYLVIQGLIEAAVLMSPGPRAFGDQIAVACFVHFMIGTLLAFGTGFVAKAVRIHEEFDGETPAISYRSALEVGILLIGLLRVLDTLPRVIARWLEFPHLTLGILEPGNLLNPETYELIGAVLLLVFAHRIAALLERVNRRPSGPEST
jgi:hypothetical protein